MQKKTTAEPNPAEITPDNIQAKVGKNIERIRKERGLTTKKVADELKLTEVAYRNIEWGISETSLKRLLQIAQVLQINYTQVLEGNSSQVVNYNNNNGTSNVFTQSNHYPKEGYLLAIAEQKEQITFLRQQNRELTAALKNKK